MRVENIRLAILKWIVITLPFGWIDLLPFPYTSLTFVLFYLYFITQIRMFPKGLSINAIKKYGIFLFIMWLIMLWRTILDGGLSIAGSGAQLRQNIFFISFFVFAVPDVERMIKQGQSVEKYFLIAIVGMIIVYFGGFVEVNEYDGRVTLQGLNSNMVALYAAAAFIILLESILQGNRFQIKTNFNVFLIPLMILLLLVIYRSGSRGGVLILAASILVYFITIKGLTKKQLFMTLFAMPIMLGAIWLMMTTGMIAERMTEIGTSDARTQRLWPAAIEVIKMYPILGAGYDRSALHMAEYIGRSKPAHNEYLNIVMSSGFVGLIFFCIFLKNIFKNTLFYRIDTGSGFRIAIFVLTILQLGKGGGVLQSPFIWIMFLMLSSPPHLRQQSEFKNL